MSVNVLGGGLSFDATIDGSQFLAQINRMEREINRITEGVKTQGNEIETWAKKASVAAASYFSLSAATDFVRSMVQVRGEFQQIEVAYRTMLKSKGAADQLMAESVKLAATTPFGLQQVAGGSKQLLAFGFAARDVTNTLEMLGNVAAGVGAPLNDIVYLYGTLKTQGRAYQRDIMQFTQRGIDIVGELAKQFGKEKDEIQAMVAAGKVGFPEVEKAFKSLTGAGGMFNDLMKEQSKTLTGLISNLEDAVDVMFNDLGKANEGFLNDSLTATINLVENYQKILDIIAILLTAYGAYRAALIIEASLKTISAARTVGMTAAEMLHYNALVLQTAAQKAYNAALLASPVAATTAAITALGLAVYALTQANNTAIEAQKGVSNISVDVTKKLETEKNKIQEYINIATDKTSSHEDQLAAIKKLNDINPTFLGGLNAQNLTTKEGTDLITKYLVALEQKALGELAYAEKQKNIQKIIELQSTGGESIGAFERAGASMKNFFSGKFTTNSKDDLNQIVDQQVKALVNANKEIDKKYGKEIKDYQLNGATVEDTTVKKTVRSESYLEDQIKKLKEDRAELDIHSNAYKEYTVKITALQDELSKAQGKKSKEDKKADTDRLKVLEDISRAEEEAYRKRLNQNQEEIQAAKDKFNALRKEATKAGLGAGSLTRIDRVEQQVTGDIRYSQETEHLKTELEKQKQIFTDFESFKEQVSLETAQNRFKDEKAEFDNYGSYLKQQLALTMSQGIAGGFTGPVQARIVEISKLLEEFNKSEKQKQDARFIEAINATQNFEQIKASIERKYQKQKEDLLKLPADEYSQRAAEIDRLTNEELDAAKNTAFQKTKIFRKLGEETLLYTKQSLRDEIKAAEDLLLSANLSPELKTNIENKLNDLKLKMEVGVDLTNLDTLSNRKADLINALSDPLVKGTEAAKKYRKELADVQMQINSVQAEKLDKMEEISTNAYLISDSFGKWAEAIGDTNSKLSDTLSTVSGVTDLLGDYWAANANIVKGIMTGDPKAIIDGVKGLIDFGAKLFSLNKKTKEMNAAARAEQKKFYDEAIRGELTYQGLLRQRERDTVARGKSSYRAIIAELDLLKSQAKPIEDAYNRIYNSLQGQEFIDGVGYEHGTWFRKAKTWDIMASLGGADYAKMEQLYTQGKLKDQAKADFEALKSLREEMQAAGVDVEDLQMQLNEMLTGTTSSGLEDSLSQLFQNGKLAAADFGDSFEEIMKNSIKNSFRYKVMEDAMKPFYESLSALMVNGTPTEEQIDALRQKYVDTSKDLADQYKNLEAITGVKLSDEKVSSNSLQGAYSSASQESISLLAGHTSAMRLTQLQTNDILNAHYSMARLHLDIAMKGINHLQKIEQNTERTAGNTERLEKMEASLISIDRKMDSDANKIKAGGI